MANEIAIRTVGHGTAPAARFVDILRSASIASVVDVRRFPGSRRHPHFGSAAMANWLAADGIGYRWLPSLGGRRRTGPVSRHVGLRTPQFRAYADHMESAEFAEGVSELLVVAASEAVAVMCSESLWWRCHRRLLADHLVLVQDVGVSHLMHDRRLSPHPVTPGARLSGRDVVYGSD